jgi:hypothetical protein
MSGGDDGGAGADGPVGDSHTIGPGGGDVGSFGDSTIGGDAFVGCATSTQKAKQLPLDLYFMMDNSGSMDDLVTAGQSKWQAIVAAMSAFLADPASTGIGVGVQYFAVPKAGVAAACTSSAQCGASGPCLLAICLKAGGGPNAGIVPCDPSTPCPKGAVCINIGECQNDRNVLCLPGGVCGNDANGFPLGTCQAMTSSFCVSGDSCNASDYATPAVPIAPLPGAAAAITSSLAGRQPQGNTPTSAALQGAIDEATSFSTANAGHTVVAVLATDGIPDECTPSTVAGVAQIAATGVSGTPSIKTFVIGVFTPNDAVSGTAAVNQIAASGGTGQAFVISTTSNVEQQFVSALNAIRGASLPCDYAIPQPDGGTPDFGKLNVQYTSGGGASTTIPYVATAAGCNPTTGGWYYDVDPAQGGVPTKILLCGASCTAIKGDAQGRIDIVLGCATVVAK